MSDDFYTPGGDSAPLNLTIDSSDLEAEFIGMEQEKIDAEAPPPEAEEYPDAEIDDGQKAAMMESAVKGLINMAYVKIGNDQLKARHLAPLDAEELAELTEATYQLYITIPGTGRLVALPPWLLATMGLMYSLQRIISAKVMERDARTIEPETQAAA